MSESTRAPTSADARPNQRVVYLDGAYLPESRASVSIRDRGFIFGDAAFDTARTFDGRIFRLDDHIARLYRSLRYLAIDPGLSPDAMAAVSEEVAARNRALLGPGEDYWVTQRVTRGVVSHDRPEAGATPTVIVDCTPLPLKARARLFRDGIEVVIPSVRRTPPECLSPNAKMHNYLNLIVAEHETRAASPSAWPILLDTRGFLCEGNGSNMFLVRDGVVLTPKAQYVLPGVSRKVVIELCADLGLAFREDDLSPFDAATADEAFVTSTSLCVCPVATINGRPVGDGAVPGPLTRTLMEGFARLAGADYVAQYLRHLEG